MNMPTLTSLLVFSLTLLTFLPTTPSTPSTKHLFKAAQTTLMDSGYLSMSLTLRLVSNTLHDHLHHSPTATIFVPSDPAFLPSGQLPLSLLQYHILPTRLPLQHLTNLPHGTSLPTLLPNFSLTVTTPPLFPPPHLSINNVTVANTPIFDDGSLLMLSIDDFFNSSSLFVPSPRSNDPFAVVSDVLRSRGCSIMATFLEAQLAEFTDGTKFTIFAPVDEAVVESVRNISDYSVIFRKHIVPRLLPWRDLIRLRDETPLPTFSDGFTITLTVSPRVRLLNGVPVALPDMFRGDFLIVHGLHALLDNTSTAGA